jgi:hypothetical protein
LNFGKDSKFLKNPEGILAFGHETFSKVLDFGKVLNFERRLIQIQIK